MGSIYNRGTRDKPRWYVSFKDVDGVRRAKNSRQPTKAQARRFLSEIESRVARGQVGIDEPSESPCCKELMDTWSEGLTNRNARDDRNRYKKHLLPVFGPKRIQDVTLPVLMRWIDKQRDDREIGESSMRHNLNLLSRFFGWATVRGYTTVNPVRQIPNRQSAPPSGQNRR